MTKRRAISPQKRAANRANARKSSGPKSSEGRSRSSLNSVKHSLTRPIDALPWGEHLDIFDEKLDVEIAKFFRQIAYRDLKVEHDKALRVLRNADRHLRRSANQLFKVLEQQ